jgi:hypothetical protein
MLIAVAVIAAAWSDAAKGGDVADVSERWRAREQSGRRVVALSVRGVRLGNADGLERDDANAIRPEFSCELAPQCVDGAQADLEAAEVEVAQGLPIAAEGEDHS